MFWKVAGAVVAAIIIFLVVAFRVTSTAHAEHIFNAPIDKVWTVWTDTEQMKKYWGPDGYHAPTIENDFTVGGKFILGMQPDKGGDIVYNAGTYREIIPQQKIIADMAFSDEKGNHLKGSDVPVPGHWPDSLVVTVEFKDMGNGKTFVSVHEEGIPLIMKLFAQMGWHQQFTKIDKLLQQ
jgi:uncharacterized protein YndB with AHSA1/START domain